MKKKIIWSVLAVVVVIIVAITVYFADLTSFPGGIKEPGYDRQVVTSGVKSTFHQGVIYRYPDFIPMLEVSGDYYEIGLQYGVLLRPEIISALDSCGKIARCSADEMGVPYPILRAVIKYMARQMASRVPQRYQDEMRGVSEGSGVSYDSVAMVNFFYDIYESVGCTGVLMKGKDGSIINAHNWDAGGGGGGEEYAKMTVIVRYKANGCNIVTHIDQPLYLGVDQSYNSKGLLFSEETLWVRKPNPEGFSYPYLIRMIMEEASSVDEVYPYLDKYFSVGGYGCLWGDREGHGALTELIPTAWAKNELKGSLLWNFNRIYYPQLAKQQSEYGNLTNLNIDREDIASIFPQKPEYTVEDAVNFVRSMIGPDGTDYSWCGTKIPVCNWMAKYMNIFDSNSEGFYIALGPYYAARQNVYHVHDDFSRPPELFMPAIPLDPRIEKAAQIENSLTSAQDKLQAFVELAKQYKDDANAQFLVAYKSFKLVNMYPEYAEKAYAMKPDVPEYKMYAGMAAYQNKDLDKAVKLLEGVNGRYPEQELYRLSVLEKAWTARDAQKAAQYKSQIQAILDKNEAQEYYKKNIIPLINALDKK
jgi:hypothetical protein